MRLALLALALFAAAPAQAGVRVVPPFDPADYADRAAIGLLVPGAGPTITRESALAALVRGKLEHGLLGGVAPGDALIELGASRRTGDPGLPAAAGPQRQRRAIRSRSSASAGLLTSDSTRIDGLVSVTDVATARLRSSPNDDPVAALETLDDRIERNDRWRLPLTIASAVAADRARFRPARATRSGRSSSRWPRTSGSRLVARAGGRDRRARCFRSGSPAPPILAAYLLALGLDAETVALSPFGPSQAGRFYGVTNLLETMLLVPALARRGAARPGRDRRRGARVRHRRGQSLRRRRRRPRRARRRVSRPAPQAAAARRPTLRLAAAVAVGAVALALLLVGLDAAIGGSSHVTDAVGDGPSALAGDIADRLELSVRRTVREPRARPSSSSARWRS